MGIKSNCESDRIQEDKMTSIVIGHVLLLAGLAVVIFGRDDL